jgi:hypothetical protein
MAVQNVDKTLRDIRRPSERILRQSGLLAIASTQLVIGLRYSLLIVLIPDSNLAGLAQIVIDRVRNEIADPAVCVGAVLFDKR